jgi:hypothetical protein
MVRLADGALCAVLVVVVELVVVAWLARRELLGPHELGLGLTSLLPLAVVAALPAAFSGAVVVATVDREPSRKRRLVLAAVVGAFALAVGWGVSGGRLLQGAGRPLFVALLVLVAMTAAFFGALPVARVLGALSSRGRAFPIAIAALGALLLEIANAELLVRRYPAFHAGLAVLTVWSAALAGTALRARRALRLGAALGVITLAALASIGAAERISRYDNLRLIYFERAPLLSHVVRLAAVLAPPPVLDDDLDAMVAPPAGQSIDLRGADVLLVTVDALRADHVGAYGYERPTTPAIDALAADGIVFEAAYTATPHTSYAVTSLMTGKYMRPLLLQGVGYDSETWAQAMRRYGYRTAAFYPPATFFIDRERFQSFEDRALDFEYTKVQFSSAETRVAELERFLASEQPTQRLFVWVHLFEPHEPYEAHPDHAFGERSIDRYDAEIAAADAAIGRLVAAMRKRHARTLVIVSADHGEEFGEHGGRYHGTSVYDEQVRVPLVWSAPWIAKGVRVAEPVGLVDLLPTVLGGLGVPTSPRVRGRDIGALVNQSARPGPGFAFAETDEQALLARGSLRLICTRRLGACRLYDVARDAGQQQDAAAGHAEEHADMNRSLQRFVASMGRYELGGEGRSWPQALRRGIAGDADAALDVAALLGDADVTVRRKAAEVLVELQADAAAPALRRALQTDEDDEVRRWSALALTRLGQGAPLTLDLFATGPERWQRLAALVLAESGDARGEQVLLGWWAAAFPADAGAEAEALPFEQARAIAAALARIKSKAAVGPLSRGLADVRLRVHVAKALADLGEEAARPALGEAFAAERYHDARLAIAEALVALDGGPELQGPLVRFLGVPDPLSRGLELALKADVLEWVGGPRDRELARLREFATTGVNVGVVIPKIKASTKGLRALVRARASGTTPGEVRFGLAAAPLGDGNRSRRVPKRAPTLEPDLTVQLPIEPGGAFHEVYATLPKAVSERVEPGDAADFVIYATQNVDVAACAVVPLADELPPPPPEPWQGESGGGD